MKRSFTGWMIELPSALKAMAQILKACFSSSIWCFGPQTSFPYKKKEVPSAKLDKQMTKSSFNGPGQNYKQNKPIWHNSQKSQDALKWH